MKKLLALLCSLLVCLGALTACGGNADKNPGNTTTATVKQDVVTTEEVTDEEITEPTTEKEQEVVAGQEVVMDNDICRITIKGVEVDDLWGYTMKLFIENKTDDKDIYVSSEYLSVNGVEETGFLYSEIAPGKAANEEIMFLDDLDEDVIGQVSDVEISLTVNDLEDYLADPLAEVVYNYYPLGKENATKYEREQEATDTVIVDNEDMTVLVTGYEWDDIWGYSANFYIVNKTDKELMFTADEISVNSLMMDAIFTKSVNPDKVAFEKMSWFESDFEENDIEDVEEIEFILRVYDYNDMFADDLYNETVTLKP